MARALISFSAFKSLKSLQNKLEKEEKLKIIREIIRLTALDTGSRFKSFFPFLLPLKSVQFDAKNRYC